MAFLIGACLRQPDMSSAAKKDQSTKGDMSNSKEASQLTVVFVDGAPYHLPDQNKINSQIKLDLKRVVED